MRAILEPLDRTYFLSAGRKDVGGSSIYPTGSVILALDQEIDATQVAQLLRCDIEHHYEQLHWITVRIPQGEHFDSFRNRCLSTVGVKDVFSDEIIVCQAHQTNDPL